MLLTFVCYTELVWDEIQLIVRPSSEVTLDEQQQVDALMRRIFSHVPREEIENDFYDVPFAVVLAKHQEAVVGYTGVYKRDIEYEREQIHLGALGGLLVSEDSRHRGIGTALAKKALEILWNEGIDVAFHSIDLEDHTIVQFYERLGYTLMKQPFTWKRKTGEIGSDMGGMIAPIHSQRLYELILNGKTPLSVGEGYW